MQERIKAATDAAEQAFWAEVAPHSPGITTGDFPPDAAFALAEAMRESIELWLEFNKPEGQGGVHV